MRLGALVAIIALACCGRASDGPPCATVAGRFFTIARNELGSANPPEELRRAVADQLPAMRDSLSKACEDGAWAAQVRECMVKAEDHVGLETCERSLTEDQLRALDRAARGEPTPR
jgi:hypothetical protein